MIKITLNPFDPASIEAAMQKLIEYRDSIAEKEIELDRRLLEIGENVALRCYAEGVASADTPMQMPTVMRTDNKILTASGPDVAFLEFGTGVTMPEWGNGGTALGYTPPARGSYGQHQGLNPWGWWAPGSIKTYGQYPAEGLLNAARTIGERASIEAREVFHD